MQPLLRILLCPAICNLTSKLRTTLGNHAFHALSLRCEHQACPHSHSEQTSCSDALDGRHLHALPLLLCLLFPPSCEPRIARRGTDSVYSHAKSHAGKFNMSRHRYASLSSTVINSCGIGAVSSILSPVMGWAKARLYAWSMSLGT